MSKYTTEVRYICEHLCGLNDSKGYTDVSTIISNSRGKIFDFPYPIFSEDYRSVLETKILKHFYTREIGEETVGLWKLRLDRVMNEIMPYYNKLYKAELDDFNPFLSTDMRTERSTVGVNERGTKELEGGISSNQTNGHTEVVTNSNNRGLQDIGNVAKYKSTDLYSDTPQGSLQGVDDEAYLTNARKVQNDNIDNGHTHTLNVGADKSTGDNTENVNNISKKDRSVDEKLNSTERFIERYYGYNGYLPADMLKKYREVIWNVDLMIMGELEPLFMQLW